MRCALLCPAPYGRANRKEAPAPMRCQRLSKAPADLRPGAVGWWSYVLRIGFRPLARNHRPDLAVFVGGIVIMACPVTHVRSNMSGQTCRVKYDAARAGRIGAR